MYSITRWLLLSLTLTKLLKVIKSMECNYLVSTIKKNIKNYFLLLEDVP